jgi:hypothetical protein
MLMLPELLALASSTEAASLEVPTAVGFRWKSTWVGKANTVAESGAILSAIDWLKHTLVHRRNGSKGRFAFRSGKGPAPNPDA